MRFPRRATPLLVWLSAALLPLEGLPSGLCSCAQAPAGATAAVHRCCCCHHGGCCRGTTAGCCCCNRPGTSAARSTGLAVGCLCGRASQPAVPPAGLSPLGLKQLLTQSSLPPTSSVQPPAAGPAGASGGHLSRWAAPLELCTTLCRFLI